MSRARAAGLLGLVALAAVACAGEETPGRRQIRPGGEPDQGRDAAAADGAFADAGPALDAQPMDFSVDLGTGAASEVWYVLHHDPVAEGLRAGLVPPQGPAGDALAATAPAPVLVVWAGPESPGAAALAALLEADRPAAPLYLMADRAAQAEADASWLTARALQHPSALRVADRPVLVVRPAPDRAGLSALRARLAALPVAPFVVLEVPLDARPWPAADAILPAQAAGHALAPPGDPAAAADAQRMRAERAAALEAGWVWLPRAGPPANLRGADPAARVYGGPDEVDLVRSLVLARRAVSPSVPVVVVDGLGAWLDDRQLDAVGGVATAAPERLTGGRLHAAYGAARLAAVDTWLGTARGPGFEVQDPVLVEFFGPAAPSLTRADDRLVVGPTSGAATWLLNARPFTLGPGDVLAYERTEPTVEVDLTFDDGTRLSDRIAVAAEVGPVAVPLGAFAGLGVIEVRLEASGPGAISGLELGGTR